MENQDASLSVLTRSTYGMRMEQMFFFTKELLKTHAPDLIIVETFAFCPLADEHSEILARRAFDAFPLGKINVDAIRYCVLSDKEQLGLNSIALNKINNDLKEIYVSSNQIPMPDMNRMWKERAIGYAEFYNEGQPNKYGAAKACRCLGQYLCDFMLCDQRKGR